MYSIFQIGGQFGITNPGYRGTFNGYAAHFIFGQNFNERAYIGVGLGNETFRGSYQSADPGDRDQSRRNYDTYLMPIFLDVRIPLGYLSDVSRFGIFADGGYAPRIGPVYDRGFLFRGGLFYLYETPRRRHYTGSLSYGYQGLQRNNHNLTQGFEHQHVSISIGFMLK